MKKNLILTIFFVLLGGFPVWSQDVQVSATVDRDTIGVNDQVQLVIRVSGEDSSNAENPTVSDLEGFSVVSGPSIGTQFQWINGRSSSSKSFTYILVPRKEGQFTIDPIEVRVNDKIFKTAAVQVRVTSAAAAPPAPPRRRNSIDPFNPFDPFNEEVEPVRQNIGDAVFVQAELDRESAYPGQQVTLSYRLYTAMRITGIDLRENPPLSGFWVEAIEIPENPKGTSETINGREYIAYTIKKQALFPTKTGELKIPASTFAIAVESGRDIFSIFDRGETIYRTTREQTLEVKPLPAGGKPDNFSNTVGNFSLSAALDKEEVEAGEAVALEVKLTGRGNLETVPDLSLPDLPDFTIYSSKHEDKIEMLEKDQIGGTKTWEYVIVPKAPGKQTIPSIEFSFFNADQNRYETATTQPLTLSVTGSNADVISSPGLFDLNKQELTRRGTDIHFIKLSTGSFEKRDTRFYRNTWFYLAFALPVFLNATFLLYRKQKSRLSENTQAVRSQKARQNALKHLKTAEKEGKTDPRRFYDLAASAFSGYLSDRFGLSEIELTGDNLERTLTMKSVPRENIEETRGCLDECDFGRFVSASASADKIASLSERIRKNIDALEKVTSGLWRK